MSDDKKQGLSLERDKMISYVHDIINKTVSAQGYLKILGKTDLSSEQAELIKNANEALKESINHIKNLRTDIRD